MTNARRKQVCLEVTPVYHCITRCVRRSFLCVDDKYNGRNYDHRRSWIEERLLLLAEVFCIELAGYSITSDHYHVVLNVNANDALTLTDDQVIPQWLKLYRGSELVQRYNSGEQLNNSEFKQSISTIEQYRDNPTNISRFMVNLNEHIARKANKEDGCKGAFWESRFKLQAVLDVPTLLQTLCYVDLNPVQAKMAKSPEQSKYTSVRRRLHEPQCGLMKFCQRKTVNPTTELSSMRSLPITFKDYLELLEGTGPRR